MTNIKYKVSFSLFNLFNSSSEEIVKLQTMWAGLATTLTTSVYISSNEKYTLFTAIGCFIVDKLITCLEFKKI